MSQLDEKILDTLKEAASRFISLKKEVAAALKLSGGEYKVVCTLSSSGGEVTQTSLSDCTGLDKPQTSRLLVRMHGAGIIEKTRKDGNRKNVYIRLSERGKKLAGKIKEKTNELKDKYFSKLDEREKVTFLKILTKNIKKESIDAET